MKAGGIEKFAHGDVLTYEEILELIKILRDLGVEKFRFTGGEPFVRKGAMEFFEKIDFPFHITTNLCAPGLDMNRLNKLKLASINVSCDSLGEDRYAFMTRGGRLDVFLSNFSRLRAKNKKLNVVLIKNFNEDEVTDFIRFASEFSATVRFIEKMDFIGDSLDFVSLLPVERKLIKKGILKEESFNDNGSVARYHKLANSAGRTGFITPVDMPFCGGCDKIRIKADGDLKLCIFDKKNFGLRDALRAGGDDSFKRFIEDAVKKKKKFPAVRKGGETPACVGG